MSKTYRVGVLGLTHDHVWSNLTELKETGQAVIAAAADPHQPLLDNIKEQYACTTYRHYEALLQHEQLDAVYIYSDNATSAALAEMAAANGLHVLIEKPMAANLEGADRMLAAVRQAGVRLMINWSFAWWPQLQIALQLARTGQLGQVWEVKYRAAHAGPKELGCTPYFYDWLFDRELNGAGVFMDYCCYGAVLARCLLGLPSRVTGIAGRLCKEDITVEDNAILVMSYPRALAVAEGSWTQIGRLTSYVTMIHGTRATLLVEPRKGGRLILADHDHPTGIEVNVPAPAPEYETGSAHFLHGLETGQPFTDLCNDRICRDAQEILEAGLMSIQKGKEVSLPVKSFVA